MEEERMNELDEQLYYKDKISLDYVKKLSGFADNGMFGTINYSDLYDALQTTDSTELSNFFDCISTYISNHSVESRILCEHGLFVSSNNWFRDPSANDMYTVEAVGLSKFTVEIVKEVVELVCVVISIDGNVVKVCNTIEEAVNVVEKELYNFIDRIILNPKSQVILAIDEVLNDYVLSEEDCEVFINHTPGLDCFNIIGPSSKSLLAFDSDAKFTKYPFLIKTYSDCGRVIIDHVINEYKDIVSVLVSEVIRVTVG